MRKIFRSVLVASCLITMSGYSASTLKELAEKYPLSITAKAEDDDWATIRITGALYEWSNSTEIMTSQIDKFLAEGKKNVKVYINSPGGDVFVAAEIINQLKRFTGKKVGFGGALVASAATAIAIELDTFEMADNGQFMYHKPSGWIQGNEDVIEAKLTLLKNLTSYYKKSYSEKTGISEEDIEANWAKGDVWLTAKQAKEQKFITSVKGNEKVTKQTAEMISACGGTPPQITNESQKFDYTMKNRNAIIAALKLSADATDEQIEAAVKDNAEKASQVTALQAQADQQKETEINALVDKAISDKKITADLKEKYVSLAKKDFDGTKVIIEAMQVVEKPEITPGATSEGREKWTMEDWQEKDPNGLAEMMVKDEAAFQKLEEAYFGK